MKNLCIKVAFLFGSSKLMVDDGVFDTWLPHPRTVKEWFNTNDCKPGFSADSFTEMAAKNKNLILTLMMDEVAITQQTEWDGKKYQRYIDYGTKINDDSLPLAKEALTFITKVM